MRVLSQIESALQSLHGWAGWTEQDRVLIKDLARQVNHLAKRYAARRGEWLKEQKRMNQ